MLRTDVLSGIVSGDMALGAVVLIYGVSIMSKVSVGRNVVSEVVVLGYGVEGCCVEG